MGYGPRNRPPRPSRLANEHDSEILQLAEDANHLKGWLAQPGGGKSTTKLHAVDTG